MWSSSLTVGLVCASVSSFPELQHDPDSVALLIVSLLLWTSGFPLRLMCRLVLASSLPSLVFLVSQGLQLGYWEDGMIKIKFNGSLQAGAVSCFCGFIVSVFTLCHHCSQSFKEHSGKLRFIIKITLKWITEGKRKIWRVSTARNRKTLASHSLECGTRNINRLINRNDFLSLKRFTLNLQRF